MTTEKVKMTTPKVSIVIPVYGVERYIERCARSLFEQTLDNIEYLFIDDCSPDKSIEVLGSVLEEYPQRKNRVVIHRMEQNSGQAAVRKWGMLHATGEYVIHCDSDDWVDKEMYRSMYEKGEKEDADIVICGYKQGSEESYAEHRVQEFKDKDSLLSAMIEHKTPVSLCNKLVKRSLIQNRDIVFPEHNFGEDFALNIQLVYNARKIVSMPDLFYFYYCNPQSITKTRNYDGYWKNWVDIHDNTCIILSFLKQVDEYKNYKSEIVTLKEDCRSFLLPIISEKNCREIYLTSFPELRYNLLDLCSKDKGLYAGRYVLIKLRLYSFAARIKTLLRKQF